MVVLNGRLVLFPQQQHGLTSSLSVSLSTEHCLRDETQIKLYTPCSRRPKIRLERTGKRRGCNRYLLFFFLENMMRTMSTWIHFLTLQSKLNANSCHSQYEEFWAEHFIFSCSLFITHPLCQGLKCNFSVAACVAEKHTVWLVHWCCLSVYSSSPWDIFFITRTGLHSAHSPSKRSSVLPVRQLLACSRGWPELPEALWLWCRCWTPAWEDRPAPDWSHRSLVEKTRDKRKSVTSTAQRQIIPNITGYFLYLYCVTLEDSCDLTSRHLIKLLAQWFCKNVKCLLCFPNRLKNDNSCYFFYCLWSIFDSSHIWVKQTESEIITNLCWWRPTNTIF